MTTPSPHDWNGHLPAAQNGSEPEPEPRDMTGESNEARYWYSLGMLDVLARIAGEHSAKLDAIAQHCQRLRKTPAA